MYALISLQNIHERDLRDAPVELASFEMYDALPQFQRDLHVQRVSLRALLEGGA